MIACSLLVWEHVVAWSQGVDVANVFTSHVAAIANVNVVSYTTMRTYQLKRKLLS